MNPSDAGRDRDCADFPVRENVNPRSVWPKEATEFTPWLAENLGARGEVLGMKLELQSREAACGDFCSDLRARSGQQPRGRSSWVGR